MKDRILEKNGSFFPQYKILFIWFYYYTTFQSEVIKVEFFELDKAKIFIIAEKRRKKQIIHYLN
jgi:hypothetical protein